MLYDKLKMYSESGVYPFHMPGHKRAGLFFPNPYQIDITEIDGFDILHHQLDRRYGDIRPQQNKAEG